MSRGFSLVETLVAMLVTGLMAAGALGYFTSTAVVAARLDQTTQARSSLALAADVIARDLWSAGSGLVHPQSDSFCPIVLGESTNAGGWAESVTIYHNNRGIRVELDAPVGVGASFLTARNCTAAESDRLLLRGIGAWEVRRVRRVDRGGGSTTITLDAPTTGSRDNASGVTVVSLSYDPTRRKLYRSLNQGTRQPLLEECDRFRVRVLNRDTLAPRSGMIPAGLLAGSQIELAIAHDGQATTRGVMPVCELLQSRFYGWEGDVQM